MKLLAFIFILLSNSLWGNQFTFESLLQDTETLESYQNRNIKIRGFLYKDPQENWILSPEPNLKSCCVGSIKKLSQQISLGKNLSFINQPGVAVTVKGIFKIEPIYDKSGALIQLFKIEDPTIHSTEYSIKNIGIIILGIFISILLIYSRPVSEIRR